MLGAMPDKKRFDLHTCQRLGPEHILAVHKVVQASPRWLTIIPPAIDDEVPKLPLARTKRVYERRLILFIDFLGFTPQQVRRHPRSGGKHRRAS
jgi:hypothetical protein